MTNAPRGSGAAAIAPDPQAKSGLVVRYGVVALILIASFFGMAGRALHLGAVEASALPSPSIATGASIGVRRGDILDRRGEILATSLDAFILVGDTREVWEPRETAAALVRILPDLDLDVTAERLARPDRRVWLARGVTPSERDAIFLLGLAGIAFETEPRRVYPRGQLGAHVIGFATVDGPGGAGAEFGFESQLAAGEDVRLTIDVRVQYVMERELGAALERYQAQAAAGVVLDAQTGEVLALASLPAFDPNAPAASPEGHRFNRALGGVFELGSVFKAITYAIALDLGRINADTVLDTEPLTVPGAVLSDFARIGRPLKAPEALAKSSNTAAARIALGIDPHIYRAYLAEFGLTEQLQIGAPETALSLLPRQWGDAERATVAYGHGISVSPLAFAAAFATAVNGGKRVVPYLAHEPVVASRPDGPPVIRGDVSATLRRWLQGVVSHGTGTRAAVDGYAIAGKTGTAEKPVDGGYDPDRKITSFAAAFPGDQPQYVLYVMLDEPQLGHEPGERALGGTTAAPLAAAIVARIGPILGVLPRREDGL